MKTSWEQVSCKDYFELIEDLSDETLEQFEKDVLVMLLVSGEELGFFEEMTLKQLKEYSRQFEWVNKSPVGGKMKCKFTKLTLGEYIDGEGGVEKKDSLKILKIVSENFNENEPVTKHIGALNEYFLQREKFIESNSENLNIESEEIQEEIKNQDFEQAQLSAKEKAQKPFSWMRFVYKLANEDITKIQKVLELPIGLVFNVVNMKKAFEI